MKSPFYHVRHAHKTFEHFHKNLHHAFVIFVLAMVGMLWWASHILTPTSANWQWGGFITSDFRSQSNDNDNLIYSLFGANAGDTTYTRLRDSTCFPETYMTTLPSTFHWWVFSGNGIYILQSGNYSLNSNITLNSCTALIGSGKVIIAGNGYTLQIANKNKVILDNLIFKSNGLSSSIIVSNSFNITLHNIEASDSVNGNPAIQLTNNINTLGDWLRVLNNGIGIYSNNGNTLNNSMIYNNNTWLYLQNSIISNSQIFNNQVWAYNIDAIYHNVMTYNNFIGYQWLSWYATILHDTTLYNNTTGITTTNLSLFGDVHLFNNLSDTWSNVVLTGTEITTPSSWWWRRSNTIDTTDTTLWYSWVTNPQNALGERLLNGVNGYDTIWSFLFGSSNKPLRYIFWSNIFKQQVPTRLVWTIVSEYWYNGYDYTTTKYIAESDSILAPEEQSIVEYYFWSESLFTQNRESNECSLSAFQIKTLDPSTTAFSSPYNFEDHTIYILTGGEYRSTLAIGNAFVFDGNCIALIGNESTRFTKQWTMIDTLFYANGAHNIIMDTIKIDGTFYNIQSSSNQSIKGITLDGTTNNSTFNNLQIYNNAQHGIYLGIWSHHININNSQIFNNQNAGIYFRSNSNYNVVNNTQIYNNQNYGIWLANWSSRNTINNFQLYNNRIWFFGDLTTTENVLNRGALYNNSEAWIYLKNSSNNMFNDLKIFNNAIAIKTLYNSPGNKYYGYLNLLQNRTRDLDGTTASDTSLSPGIAWLFAYEWSLTTGDQTVSCQYASNPTLPWNATLLGNECAITWYKSSFISWYNTNVHYTFWVAMQQQTIPVKYLSGWYLEEMFYQYDESKFITEMFALRDSTPENIIFPSISDTEFSTWYTSSGYTVASINTTIDIWLSFAPSSTSGYLIINGTQVGSTWTVVNGDIVQIKAFSASWYNQSIVWTVTLGTATGTFTLTTRGLNQLPTLWSFNFSSFSSLETNIFTGSTTTVAGIETGISASITFAPSTNSGRLEIYSGATLMSMGTTGLVVYNGNQVKVRAQSSSWYAETITGTITLGLWTGEFTLKTKWGDTIPPSTPTITYPLSGNYMYYVNFQRTASVDTWSWIQWYMYQIADDNNFLDITHVGFITTTGTIWSPDITFTPNSGRHYVKIRAKDRDGNYSDRSNIWYLRMFPMTDQVFTGITWANLINYYTSDIVEIQWISTWVLLYATTNENTILYKNGEERWTWAFVENNDLVYLKVRSSNTYTTITTGTLTIANRVLAFPVKTKTSTIAGCSLSDEDRDDIQMVFDTLVENYANNSWEYEEFLYTMQSMLSDEISFDNNCNLMYLQDLIQQALGMSQWTTINTESHTAPNCKIYQISYDITNLHYTSPTITTPIYFANRDTLTKYIDSKNPGDCHIASYVATSRVFTNTNSSKHIATNGKIYYITIENGKYTSNNFTSKKYFNSLGELRAYIDSKNPASQVWNHTVDTSFTPEIYAAPNAKEYKIYKTNKWFMSYKLLNVRYFSSLTDLHSYININNPK